MGNCFGTVCYVVLHLFGAVSEHVLDMLLQIVGTFRKCFGTCSGLFQDLFDTCSGLDLPDVSLQRETDRERERERERESLLLLVVLLLPLLLRATGTLAPVASLCQVD